LGKKVEYISDSSQIIRNSDNVFVVSALTANEAKKHGARKIITWWQGLMPEESYSRNMDKSFLGRKLRLLVLNILENKGLKNTDVHLFVSDSMRRHYAKKYGYDSNNFVIMPCFNENLHEGCFSDEHYITPSFVYAGGLSRWQCFEPMVKLFSEIKEQIPTATLSLYVKDSKFVQDVLGKYGVEAKIQYVSQDQLPNEMKKYKYGFILRDDLLLNRVATPTKMSTYMSSGVIPVYSDVIDAFHENLGNLQYTVPLSTDGTTGLEKLIKLENTVIKGTDVQREYKNVFQTFYNADYYIPLIASKIEECCK